MTRMNYYKSMKDVSESCIFFFKLKVSETEYTLINFQVRMD